MSTKDSPDKNTGDDAGEQFDDWFEMLKATADRFEEENDDLEAMLEGNIGFHAFFVADGDDKTRGAITAIFQALFETTQELHVDADIVESNNGDVTPETVADEVIGQLEHEVGLYLSDHFRENIRDRVEKRVRKNQRAEATA